MIRHQRAVGVDQAPAVVRIPPGGAEVDRAAGDAIEDRVAGQRRLGGHHQGARPETNAAAGEVPLVLAYPCAVDVVTMSTPGAAMSIQPP